MKRTSPWVYVAGVAIQLAALGLCVWAMERWLPPEPETPEPAPPAPPASDRQPEPEPEPTSHLHVQASPPVASVPPWAPARAPAGSTPTPPPAATVPEPAPAPAPATPPPAAPPSPPPPNGPLFGPPPVSPQRPGNPAVPRFVLFDADGGTQVLRGRVGDGSLVIGIAPDGDIRCVDVDGARYSGRSESARARLREVDGSRSFTVQIGVDAGGALHASFTGGEHDGETIALAPLVEGSAS